MKRRSIFGIASSIAWLLINGNAEAQITITKARIGCLDIQIDGNLTAIVGGACNNKTVCSYKAPQKRNTSALECMQPRERFVPRLWRLLIIVLMARSKARRYLETLGTIPLRSSFVTVGPSLQIISM